MNIHNSIKIVEPLRWKKLMLWLNDWIIKHDLLVQIVPYTADIFVFSYPIYLVVLYLWWIGKKKEYYKEAALYFFFSTVATSSMNMLIQFFGDKSRPEWALNNKHQLILGHLPNDPFPSDHAAVSATIAMATMLWWIKHKDKTFLKLSIFFWFACGVMSVSRVAVAIHRPTDILAGIIVGVAIARLLLNKKIWKWLVKWILKPLIRLEEWIFEKVFGIIEN